MRTNYNFFHYSEMKIDNFDMALKVIKDENLVVGVEHLEILEAAERGCFYALCDVAILFSEGAKGIKPNYKVSKKYHKIIEGINKGDPITEHDAHRSNAFLEMNFQNLEAAKHELIEAIKIMVNNFPVEKWNFNSLHNLENILKYQAENQTKE